MILLSAFLKSFFGVDDGDQILLLSPHGAAGRASCRSYAAVLGEALLLPEEEQSFDWSL